MSEQSSSNSESTSSDDEVLATQEGKRSPVRYPGAGVDTSSTAQPSASLTAADDVATLALELNIDIDKEEEDQLLQLGEGRADSQGKPDDQDVPMDIDLLASDSEKQDAPGPRESSPGTIHPGQRPLRSMRRSPDTEESDEGGMGHTGGRLVNDPIKGVPSSKQDGEHPPPPRNDSEKDADNERRRRKAKKKKKKKSKASSDGNDGDGEGRAGAVGDDSTGGDQAVNQPSERAAPPSAAGQNKNDPPRTTDHGKSGSSSKGGKPKKTKVPPMGGRKAPLDRPDSDRESREAAQAGWERKSRRRDRSRGSASSSTERSGNPVKRLKSNEPKPGDAFRRKYLRDAGRIRCASEGYVAQIPLYAQETVSEADLAAYPALDPATGDFICPFCLPDRPDSVQSFRVPFRVGHPTPELLNMHVAAYHYPWVAVLRCIDCSQQRRRMTFAYWDHLEDHYRDEHPGRVNFYTTHRSQGGARFRTGDPEFNRGYLPPLVPAPDAVSIRRGDRSTTTWFGPWLFARRIFADEPDNQGREIGTSASLPVRQISHLRGRTTSADVVRGVPPERVESVFVPSEEPAIRAAQQGTSDPYDLGTMRPAGVPPPLASAAGPSYLLPRRDDTPPAAVQERGESRGLIQDLRDRLQAANKRATPSSSSASHSAASSYPTTPEFRLPTFRPVVLKKPPSATVSRPPSAGAPVPAPGPARPSRAPTSTPPGVSALPDGEAMAALMPVTGNPQQSLHDAFGPHCAEFFEQSRTGMRDLAQRPNAPCRDRVNPRMTAGTAISEGLQRWSEGVQTRFGPARNALPWEHPRSPTASTADLAVRMHVEEVATAQRTLAHHQMVMTRLATQTAFEAGLTRGAEWTHGVLRLDHEDQLAQARRDGILQGRVQVTRETASSNAAELRCEALQQQVDTLTDSLTAAERRVQQLTAAAGSTRTETERAELLLFPYFANYWGATVSDDARRHGLRRFTTFLTGHDLYGLPDSIPRQSVNPDPSLLVPPRHSDSPPGDGKASDHTGPGKG